MAGGVVIEFSHFGDFDSFDIIRSETPINPSSPPDPIVSGLTTMAYIDRSVVLGTVYYYRAAVWRGAERLLSAEDVKVLAVDGADPYWENVVSLVSMENGVITDHAPTTTPRTWTLSSGVMPAPSSDVYLSEQSMFFNDNSSLQASFGMELGTGDYTVEFFVKGTNIDSSGPFTVLSLFNGTYHIYGIDQSKAKMISNGSDIAQYNPPQPIRNKWTHIAFVKSAGNILTFVDGVLLGTAPTSARNLSGIPAFISASNNLGSNKFMGYIEQIRVTKDVARYTASFDPLISRFPDYQ